MNAEELFSEWRKLWEPPQRLPLSQWAEQNFYTSPEYSAVTRQLRLHEYQREPFDCFTDPRVSDIVIKSGTQMLKTLFLQVAMAYVAIADPGPCLLSQYKETDVEMFSKERIAPMIRDIPGLQAIAGLANKSRTSGSTATYKEFPGGSWSMVGAGVAGNAARRSIRFLFCDEVNKYEATKEGNFTELAKERTATYGTRAKRAYTCSPTTPEGLISRMYDASDQRKPWVPCPDCGEYQLLKWGQVKWDNEAPPEDRPSTARYECEHCGAHWNDNARIDATSRVQWRASKPFRGIAGFGHLGHLYSPYKTLAGMVSTWLAISADKSPEAQNDLRVFINTNLAEEFVERGEAPDWQRLYDRRENYEPGKAQPGVLFVTAGCDVQKDRVEIQVVGWGRGKESWCLDYVIFEGDPFRAEIWTKVSEFLNQTYPHPSGVDLPIARFAIDSGYATNEVYSWARKQAPGRVMVIKGVDHGAAIVGHPSDLDVRADGRYIRRGIKVWPLNVSTLKSELYGQLRLERPTVESGSPFPPGYCHFPEFSEEFFRQITAEELHTKIIRGYPRQEWVKLRRNEVLDTRGYARGGASAIGIDRFQERHWAELEAMLRVEEAPATVAATEAPVPQAYTAMRRPRPQIRLGGF